MLQHKLVKRYRRVDALDDELLQGPLGPRHRLLPVHAPDDQLRQHGVVEGRDDVLGVHVAVHPHPVSARRVETRDLARGGHEVPVRVLGVDPAFDGVSPHLHVFLRESEGMARGDADLFLYEVL